MTTTKPTEITIFATDETARKFLLFQEYFEVFNLMLEKKVFEQKKAAVTLHFDHNGTLQVIERADFLYSRKFDS